MKPVCTWVVIADGARARIAINRGPGKGLEDALEAEFAHAPRKSGDIQADRPGRSYESVGGARHGMEPPTDPHEHDKAEFLREVADYVGKAAGRNRFDRLVLVAPPRALGALRDLLSGPAAAKVTGDLAKDLTHVPLHELAGHLGEVMAP